jgi:hypothetical protein
MARELTVINGVPQVTAALVTELAMHALLVESGERCASGKPILRVDPVEHAIDTVLAFSCTRTAGY